MPGDAQKAVDPAAIAADRRHPPLLTAAGDACARTPPRALGPAGTQAHWMPAVEQALDTVAASHALLVLCDTRRSPTPIVTGVRMDDADLRRFQTAECDEWMQIYRRGLRPGKTTTWSQIVCDREFEVSPLYNEIVRPAGGFYAIATQQQCGPLSYFLALCRPRRAGDYELRETVSLNAQLPLVTATLQLESLLLAAEARCRHLSHVLDRLEIGIVLVDCSSQPLFINHAAELMLPYARSPRESPGTFLFNGRTAANLRRLIDSQEPGSIDIDCNENRLPLKLFVVPCGQEAMAPCLEVDAMSPAAIIFVTDPERRHLTEIGRRVQLMFGMTPSEAALASALMHGDTIQSYAACTGRSYNTVKTHLRSVFLKTGTSRQVDLVREIAGACLLRF